MASFHWIAWLRSPRTLTACPPSGEAKGQSGGQWGSEEENDRFEWTHHEI